jgi:transcriptional regulator with XRE-family HTH domain
MPSAAPTSNNLAREIRNARKSVDLTQQELADLSGVSVASIRSWEQGVCAPERSFALRIVRATLASLNDEGRPVRPPPSVQRPFTAAAMPQPNAVAYTPHTRRAARLAAP